MDSMELERQRGITIQVVIATCKSNTTKSCLVFSLLPRTPPGRKAMLILLIRLVYFVVDSFVP